MIGIYKLYNNGVVVYVGQSINVFSRVKAHKTDKLIDFDFYKYFFCDKHDLDTLEKALINKYKPIHNGTKKNKKAGTAIAKGEEYLVRNCKNCGKVFKTTSFRAKFCCSTCRVQHWNKTRYL